MLSRMSRRLEVPGGFPVRFAEALRRRPKAGLMAQLFG
jgi:hypothetical protein